MFKHLCHDISSLFPSFDSTLFPHVDEIMKVDSVVNCGLYSDNPKPFVSHLVKNGALQERQQESLDL